MLAQHQAVCLAHRKCLGNIQYSASKNFLDLKMYLIYFSLPLESSAYRPFVSLGFTSIERVLDLGLTDT